MTYICKMVIKTVDEADYIAKYLGALQGLMGLSNRELQVAIVMVQKYVMLEKVKSKLETKKGKAEFDVMRKLKEPESLAKMTQDLNMSFPVFKNYVSALKRKGFFKGKTINPVCIPKGKQTTLTFKYDPI